MSKQDAVTRYKALVDEMNTIANRSEPSDEDTARFEVAEKEAVALEATIKRYESVERAAGVGGMVSGDGTQAASGGAGQWNKGVGFSRSAGDPYDMHGVPTLRSEGYSKTEARTVANEYRDRARRAIDTARFADNDGGQVATGHVESDRSGLVAAHVLKTGSEAYREGFEKFLSNPTGYQMDLTNEERTAMSLTGANGGFLVPFMLDPTIMLSNNSTTNPFRQISTIKTTMTNSWNGVTSAGVTAEWLAENTSAADASPIVAQAPIPVYKAAAFIQASFEVIEDSGIAGDISMLISDARDRLESAAFANGTGSGQPTGVITALGLVTASRVAGTSGAAGAADFVIADVFALANGLPPRARPNSSWLAEQSVYNKVRLFATGSGIQTGAFWSDLNAGLPPMLLGRPTYECSELDSTIVSGSNDDVMTIGDFRSGYYIVDRLGVSVAYEPLMKSQSTGRPDGSVGFFATWRVGGAVINAATNFRMLRL